MMGAQGSSALTLPQRGLLRWPVVNKPLSGLILLFALSLPFVNPYVHGDGVGYYAYARALIVQGNLRFEQDWLRASEGFSRDRRGSDGTLADDQYTDTGYVNNVFTVGPGILWSPFLATAHGSVLVARRLGSSVPADGFSWPYQTAMGLGTALYGFLSLLFSFAMARKFVEERWAFLATVGIWAASSLPVYMYFNPSWSHAHSAFVVALFLWFWERTRPRRTLRQWIVLGLIGGMMLNTYFPNVVFLLVPLVESLRSYFRFRTRDDFARQLAHNVAFAVSLIIAFTPTLATRLIIFGGLFRFGSYGQQAWDWTAPHWFDVLFSANHGLLSWTPLLALALLGLFFTADRAKALSFYLALAALAFYYLIASYPHWNGMSSFGNRFFISLTPIFIFGLACFFDRAARLLPQQSRPVVLASLVGFFSLWNAGFIFQWGTQMIPPRGAISWKQMTYNQVFVVPARITADLRVYFAQRMFLMERIEEKDLEWRSSQQNP
jgi:hypothetical protein